MRQLLAILIISIIVIGCGKNIVGGHYDEPEDDGPVIQRACDHCHAWDFENGRIPPPKEENRK